jgi:tetratricopeptide (TPR) repeat protein
VAITPEDASTWVLVTAAHAAAGDAAAYRGVCRRMLERFGHHQDPVVAQRVGLGCLLMPEATNDQKLPVQLAEFSFNRAPRDPWCLITHGLSLYRSGQFEKAAQQFQSLLKTRPEDGGPGHEPIVSWLTLALANYRLGQAEQARRWLDKAVRRIHEQEKMYKLVPGFASQRSRFESRAELAEFQAEADAVLAELPGKTKKEVSSSEIAWVIGPPISRCTLWERFRVGCKLETSGATVLGLAPFPALFSVSLQNNSQTGEPAGGRIYSNQIPFHPCVCSRP